MLSTDVELNNIDPEDIEDLLIKVEKSFNVKFVTNDLKSLFTFGDLCDCIKNKIKLEHADNCTKQQAFYKLRNALSTSLDIKNIKTTTLVADIFPKQKRLSTVTKVENGLGFKLSFLRPKHSVTAIYIIIFVVSLIALSINWILGLLGILLSIVGLYFANIFGKEMDITTIGELSEKMTSENYLRSRRNSSTFNRSEIEIILTEWFSKELDLDKSKLTRDAKF